MGRGLQRPVDPRQRIRHDRPAQRHDHLSRLSRETLHRRRREIDNRRPIRETWKKSILRSISSSIAPASARGRLCRIPILNRIAARSRSWKSRSSLRSCLRRSAAHVRHPAHERLRLRRHQRVSDDLAPILRRRHDYVGMQRSFENRAAADNRDARRSAALPRSGVRVEAGRMADGRTSFITTATAAPASPSRGVAPKRS